MSKYIMCYKQINVDRAGTECIIFLLSIRFAMSMLIRNSLIPSVQQIVRTQIDSTMDLKGETRLHDHMIHFIYEFQYLYILYIKIIFARNRRSVCCELRAHLEFRSIL